MYIQTREQLANNLRNMRNLKGISSQQVADILNIHRTTYVYYESTKSCIAILDLIKLARFYDVDVRHFLVADKRQLLKNKNLDLKHMYIVSEYELGRNLCGIREDRDLTRTEIAVVLGIKRSTYSYYELGRVSIGIFKLLKLTKVYDIDVIYFLLKGGERNVL